MDHTPGPWKRIGVTVEAPNHIHIATCVHSSWARLQAVANARLIAAAPELLAAARSVVAKWDETLADYPGAEPILGWPAEIDKLRAAIAKAKGKA